MGIAKIMSVIGEYNFHAKNTDDFIKCLASKFEVNLQVNFADMTSKYNGNVLPDKYFDFGYKTTYQLAIDYFDYDDDKPDPTNIYCKYYLHIPVNWEYEGGLSLVFNPNSIFELEFIPFSNSWMSFIENIKGINDHYYTSHNRIVKQIKVIRDCYISILKKINCKEVILWTDANYKSEDEFIFNQIPEKVNTLNEVKNAVNELDNITLYNFIDSVVNKSNFDNRSGLDIAFLDNLEESFPNY